MNKTVATQKYEHNNKPTGLLAHIVLLPGVQFSTKLSNSFIKTRVNFRLRKERLLSL